MNVEEIIGAIIESQHGWAVRDQFIDTWHSGDFENQNLNALRYIKNTIDDLANSGIFSEEVEMDLVGYLIGLKEYLADPLGLIK